MTETPEPDVLEVLPDGRNSRYAKTAPRPPVTGFDPDDITTVDAKVQQFWTDYPNGRIETSIDWIEVDGFLPMVQATAWVWTHRDHDMHTVSAHANRTPGEGDEPYNEFPTETAESTAIGRCMRFLPSPSALPPIKYNDARSPQEEP